MRAPRPRWTAGWRAAPWRATSLALALFGLSLTACQFDTAGPRHLRWDAAPPDSITFWDGAADRQPSFEGGVDGSHDGLGDGADSGLDATVDQASPPAHTGQLVFGTSDPTTQLRQWNGSTRSWLAAPWLPPVSLDLRWARIRSHVDGDVLVLKGLDQGNDRTQIWQRGLGGWTEVPALRQEPQDAALLQIRDMALGREALSGDLLLVLGAGDKAPHYATFSGGQWSALQRLPAAVKDGDDVWWVELVPRAGSDELMLLYSDKTDDLYGVRWDGSAWEDVSFKELTNDLKKFSNRGFDGAYEGASGDFLAVWGRDSKEGIQHATWDGVSWVKSADNEFYTGKTYFVDLAADPRLGSNRIAGAFVDLGGGTERLAAGVWDGEQWVGLKEYDGQIYDYSDTGQGDAASAVGWADGTAVCLYREEGGVLKWLSWEESSSDWTLHEALSVAGMGMLESVLMASQTHPSAGVVALLSDDEQQLFGLFFDGQSWQRLGLPPLSSALSSGDSVPFDFALVQ